jgi:DNA-binding transcriptional MerR regulator
MAMIIFGKKDVLALTGLTYRQMDYWATSGVVRPSIKLATGKGSRREYSFRDLVQLRVAKALRDGGISVQKIRKTLAWLRRHFPEIREPLAELRFITDGANIFVLDRNPEKIMDTLKGGQLVFSLALGDIIERLQGELKKLVTFREERVWVGNKVFTVILASDPKGGGYTAQCKEIPSSISRGETEQETLDNIQEVLEEQLKRGKESERSKR